MGEPLRQGQHQPSSLHSLCLTPADRKAKRDQFQTRKVFSGGLDGFAPNCPLPLYPLGVLPSQMGAVTMWRVPVLLTPWQHRQALGVLPASFPAANT